MDQITININTYKRPSLTPFLFDGLDSELNNIAQGIKNFFTPLNRSCHIEKKKIDTKRIPGKFNIRYNHDLNTYMIDLYIGKENQRVSVILDTTQIDLLIPTPCCINTGCLQDPNYGFYYFKNSSSCIVPLPNQSNVKCQNEDCYTISTLQSPEDEKMIQNYGAIKKVTVYDYVDFVKNYDSKNRKRTKMNLILGFLNHERYLAGSYIPPTLGLAPDNVLHQDFIFLDLYNNFLSFTPRSGGIKLINDKNVSNAFYSGMVDMVTLYQMKLNRLPLSVIFDTGSNMIFLPHHLADSILSEIRNHSNISFDSGFWNNEIVQINSFDTVVLPDVVFHFRTEKGFYKWILKKEDYVINRDSKYELLITRNNNSKEIRFGNRAMQGHILGLEFDNERKESNVYVYQ